MPAQLLSPAGLLSLDPSTQPRRASTAAAAASSYNSNNGTTTTASELFLSANDRRQLNLGNGKPPIKRTASTASIDDPFLNPSSSLNHPLLERVIDPNDLSSDGDDIGTQEDWEMEEDDCDEQEDITTSRVLTFPSPRKRPSQHRQTHIEDCDDRDDNPFLVTTPPAATPMSSGEAGSSSMMVNSMDTDEKEVETDEGDGGSEEDAAFSPTSPTAARVSRQSKKRDNTGASKAKRNVQRIATRKAAEERNDADDDNPFMTRPGGEPPRAPRKRSNEIPKVSYVFRGKRITYDAPLEDLFPASDESDSEEGGGRRKKTYPSGPRILFPPKPAPASPPITGTASGNVSPDASGHSIISKMELMQTPRRRPLQLTEDGDELELQTPQQVGRRKDGAQADGLEMTFSAKPRERDAQPIPPPHIPPTPASLPQKVKTKEQRSIERERLNGAMRGIQATAHAIHQAATGSDRSARRYGPYPPR